MRDSGRNTEAAILEAAKREFLTYGYDKASLRRIAREASVTTGAIYGYFSGKEALFEALTGPVESELTDVYERVHQEFAKLPPDRQPEELMNVTEENIPWMIHYVYDHFDEFKLLLCCNAPGAAERFLNRLQRIEEKSCRDLIEAVRSMGRPVPELNPFIIHVLCTDFFQQLQEFVTHDVSREDAVECALTMGRFRHAGWIYLLQLEDMVQPRKK